MDRNKRTFINVFAQYVRTVINICLSLYTTRLVTQALGESDYGLFMVVAGVVTMLAFLTNAMVVTTQRHLSFFYGKNNLRKVKSIFSNTLFLHITLGVLLVLLFWAMMPFLINEKDGFLNIKPDRIEVAKYVFLLAVANMFISFLTAPFRGLFIARENIVYISVVDVCDGILKVILVLFMLVSDADKLLLYAFILLCVQLLNLLAFSLFAKYKYEECSLLPKIKDVKGGEIKRIFSFAGWTIYSTACIIFRTQGIAVLLNRFFGTVINFAYGIASQVAGSAAFLAQAILNAMSPRVIKAEGAGDREGMLRLAGVTSKFCFLLLSMFAIPLCFEMMTILSLWLGEERASANTVFFCQCVVIAAMCDQLTIGLGIANQAIGRIRNYSLLVNTTKVLTLPLVWMALTLEMNVKVVMFIYIIMECVCFILRLFYLKATTTLSIAAYSKQVFLRVMPPTLALVVVCFLCTILPHTSYRFVITFTVAVIVDVIVIYFASLDSSEKQIVINIFKKLKK